MEDFHSLSAGESRGGGGEDRDEAERRGGDERLARNTFAFCIEIAILIRLDRDSNRDADSHRSRTQEIAAEAGIPLGTLYAVIDGKEPGLASGAGAAAASPYRRTQSAGVRK